MSILAIPARAVTNKPNWSVNPAAFEQGMDVTSEVFFGSTAVTVGGMVGAFIDEVLVGVKDEGVTAPPFLGGKYSFTIRVFGNSAGGKSVTFKFYDTARDKVYSVTETVTFVADGVVGSAIAPTPFHCILGTDATLSDLQVSGTTVAGFSPSTITYNSEVPIGTVVVPTVTATTTDSKATKVITNAPSLPGSTTVVVTSEDLSTVKTYTVNFVWAVPIADFSADVTSTCLAHTVTFTDKTTNSPTTWAWTFSPSTVTYTGGTQCFFATSESDF